MENIIWKDIKGYEGFYQVSNYGQVKSLERFRKSNRNSFSIVRERIMKSKVDKYGYLAYSLCKDNKMSYFTSHRLVAIAFIPNTNNYNQVNHINGNKLDNSVSNLEWCDNQHNMRESFRLGLNKARKSKDNVLSKKVAKIKDGVIIKEYYSLTDASVDNNVVKSAIGNCLKNRSKSCAGFEWSYI
jgi:hypothetical protein